MTTPIHPEHPSNPSAGDKLRALAHKINKDNNMSICSLLLVAGIAVTLGVMAQNDSLPREKKAEITADFRVVKSPMIELKPDSAEISPSYIPTWEKIGLGKKNEATGKIRVNMQVYSQHSEGDNPHVIAYVWKGDLPELTIIPKDICTEAGWQTLLKSKPRPEFAEKWGYTIPTAVGEASLAGTGKELVAPKEAPVVVAPTMPVERTITNTEGKSLDGTILSKTESTISYEIKASRKKVDIKLDQLSAEDQAFIATLVDKKNAKPTVLFLLSQDYEETTEVRTWLANNGFDVKIGLIRAGGYGPTSYRMPGSVTYVTIDPMDTLDQFDVIWIGRFSTDEQEGKEEWSHFAVVNHCVAKNKVLVIPTHSKLDKPERFLSFRNYYAGNLMLGPEERAYVKAVKNFIFCSDKPPHNTDEGLRKKLLESINIQLGR
jgi:hypothetical protein